MLTTVQREKREKIAIMTRCKRNYTSLYVFKMSRNPVFEAMASLPRSMASSLVALPRSCHDLAMILARMPWPCKIVQRLTMINHDLGKGSMVTLAKFLENSELLFSNCN